MKFEMPYILYDYYQELGEKEEFKIHNELMRKSKGPGSIYERVAENMTSLVRHTGSQNFVESVVLEIGASDRGNTDIEAGVTGSRGEDIAGILQYGKREGKALSKDIDLLMILYC